MPTFQYDTDGNRTLTVQPDGTILYTPFPDYELTDPPTGADTVRTTYRLGGQIVAVQTKVGAAAGAFYFTYTDHLGNISAMSTAAGTFVAGSKARYDPFGTMTTAPATNPSISSHGFTGHRHNNTGTNNLGLIYMNARYYMPLAERLFRAEFRRKRTEIQLRTKLQEVGTTVGQAVDHLTLVVRPLAGSMDFVDIAKPAIGAAPPHEAK